MVGVLCSLLRLVLVVFEGFSCACCFCCPVLGLRDSFVRVATCTYTCTCSCRDLHFPVGLTNGRPFTGLIGR